MHRRALAALTIGAVLLLAACSSSGATTAPSAAAPSAAAPSAAAPSAEASTAASPSAAGGSAACSQGASAGQVAVSIKDFAFGSGDIQAKVGQVITFTNNDSAPHTATLDDGSCTTGTIASGSSDGLMFTAAGTYAFHCKIHSSMHGKITVS
jgi:plastocyanin